MLLYYWASYAILLEFFLTNLPCQETSLVVIVCVDHAYQLIETNQQPRFLSPS